MLSRLIRVHPRESAAGFLFAIAKRVHTVENLLSLHDFRELPVAFDNSIRNYTYRAYRGG